MNSRDAKLIADIARYDKQVAPELKAVRACKGCRASSTPVFMTITSAQPAIQADKPATAIGRHLQKAAVAYYNAIKYYVLGMATASDVGAMTGDKKKVQAGYAFAQKFLRQATALKAVMAADISKLRR